MIWAILADVHGNLEALRAVAEDCRNEGVQQTVFLGDAVGYGSDPNECLSILKELTDLRVAGNHDYGAVGLTDVAYFNPEARAAIEWTREKLSEENRQMLRTLPLVRQAGDLTCVHSTLDRPEEWNYIFTGQDAEESFLTSRMRAPVERPQKPAWKPARLPERIVEHQVSPRPEDPRDFRQHL